MHGLVSVLGAHQRFLGLPRRSRPSTAQKGRSQTVKLVTTGYATQEVGISLAPLLEVAGQGLNSNQRPHTVDQKLVQETARVMDRKKTGTEWKEKDSTVQQWACNANAMPGTAGGC